MVKRLMAVMLVAALAVAAAQGVAEADEPDYTDPKVVTELIAKLEKADDVEDAFADLPSDAQQAVVDAFRNADIQVETIEKEESGFSGASDDPGTQPEAEKCDTHTVRVTKKLARIKIYTYESSTRWCFNGQVITQTPVFDVSGRLHWKVWWEFVGHVRTKETGGRGDRLHSDFAQGHFKNCVPDFGCVSYNPSIKKTQSAKGVKSSQSHED